MRKHKLLLALEFAAFRVWCRASWPALPLFACACVCDVLLCPFPLPHRSGAPLRKATAAFSDWLYKSLSSTPDFPCVNKIENPFIL